MFNLLASCKESIKTSWPTYLLMAGLIGVIVVFMFLSSRSRKKREQETMDMLNAIQPGNKVKTIGGICGIVVEVCPEDNTFVLETGTEASGKSYIKFDKQAVYQTDAVVKKEVAPAAPAAPVAPAEENDAELAPEFDAPAEETEEKTED